MDAGPWQPTFERALGHARWMSEQGRAAFVEDETGVIYDIEGVRFRTLPLGLACARSRSGSIGSGPHSVGKQG
jgi:hypothetical protein